MTLLQQFLILWHIVLTRGVCLVYVPPSNVPYWTTFYGGCADALQYSQQYVGSILRYLGPWF